MEHLFGTSYCSISEGPVKARLNIDKSTKGGERGKTLHFGGGYGMSRGGYGRYTVKAQLNPVLIRLSRAYGARCIVRDNQSVAEVRGLPKL